MSEQREHEEMIHVTFVASFLSLPSSIHQMQAVRISMVSRVAADGRLLTPPDLTVKWIPDFYLL